LFIFVSGMDKYFNNFPLKNILFFLKKLPPPPPKYPILPYRVKIGKEN